GPPRRPAARPSRAWRSSCESPRCTRPGRAGCGRRRRRRSGAGGRRSCAAISHAKKQVSTVAKLIHGLDREAALDGRPGRRLGLALSDDLLAAGLGGAVEHLGRELASVLAQLGPVQLDELVAERGAVLVGRRSADAREQTRAAARASDGDDAPQRPKFNRRGRSPATLDASRELTNQFFRRAPWSFEATALRADRTQMSNLHAYEPEDPRLFRRGRLERAREDPREARLRTPAPVYLGHCPATRRIQAEIRAALDSREHVLVSGAPGPASARSRRSFITSA